mgnify:CR=1 FL=1
MDNSITLTPGYQGKSATGKSGPAVASKGLLHSFLLSNDLWHSLWLNLLSQEQIAAAKVFPAGVGTAPWEVMPMGEACTTAQQLQQSLMGRLVPLCPGWTTEAVPLFLVAPSRRQFTPLVRALRDAGHEIGNHTYDHLDMLGLDAATARDQIARGQDILASTLGDPGWWFRPSGTSHSNETIRAAAVELGYGPCVSYDVDPEDFRDPGAALVASRTLAAAQAGSIVSLHLGHPGTVTALPGILSTLAERGLKAVTLTTLLRDSPGHPTP